MKILFLLLEYIVISLVIAFVMFVGGFDFTFPNENQNDIGVYHGYYMAFQFVVSFIFVISACGKSDK